MSALAQRGWRAALLAMLLGCGPGPASSASSEGSAGGEDPDAEVRFIDEEPAPPERHAASPAVAEAEALLASGNVADAERMLREAVAATPDDPRAQLDLGLALELQNQWEEAEAAYRAAIALDPEFPEALNNLGVLLRDEERPEEAAAMLRRAVASDPRYGEAWLNLALALEESGDDAAARDAYREAVRFLPEDAAARANFGLLLVRLGERDPAAIELTRALRLARLSGDAPTAAAVGNGLRRIGEGASATRALTLAIELNGATPALLAERALAENAAGDKAAAEASLAAALELDGGFAMAHYLLGGLKAGRGAYAEAVVHYESYLRLAPRGAQAERARERLGAARSRATR